MSEEYGANFITVTDEEGNEFELEHLDTIEFQGQTYLAFFPAVQDGEEAQNEEEMGLVILKAIQENGEEILSTLDSDEEIDAVYNEFMKELFAEEEESRNNSLSLHQLLLSWSKDALLGAWNWTLLNPHF